MVQAAAPGIVFPDGSRLELIPFARCFEPGVVSNADISGLGPDDPLGCFVQDECIDGEGDLTQARISVGRAVDEALERAKGLWLYNERPARVRIMTVYGNDRSGLTVWARIPARTGAELRAQGGLGVRRIPWAELDARASELTGMVDEVVAKVTLKPGFNVALTPDGAKKFERISSERVGRTLAIIIDGKVVMAPKILDPVRPRGFLLTLNSEAEARELAEKVRQVVAPE